MRIEDRVIRTERDPKDKDIAKSDSERPQISNTKFVKIMKKFYKRYHIGKAKKRSQ